MPVDDARMAADEIVVEVPVRAVAGDGRTIHEASTTIRIARIPHSGASVVARTGSYTEFGYSDFRVESPLTSMFLPRA